MRKIKSLGFSLMVLVFACENERMTSFYSDVEFRNYVDQFFKDAADRGYELPKDNMLMRWKTLKVVCDYPTTGITRKDLAQWVCDINKDYNHDTPEQRAFNKIMVYRELFRSQMGKPYEANEFIINVNGVDYLNPLQECFSWNFASQFGTPHVNLSDPAVLDYLFTQ
jgi:hypothetical protein